jgi:hypothetical protein
MLMLLVGNVALSVCAVFLSEWTMKYIILLWNFILQDKKIASWDFKEDVRWKLLHAESWIFFLK